VNSGWRVALGHKPGGGGPIDDGSARGLLGVESLAQVLSEQRMKPIPATCGIKRCDKQMAAFKLGDHGATVGALQHGVAQRRRPTFQQRRRQQEVIQEIGIFSHDLAGNVIGQRAVCATDRGGDG
jgi:hypothetical protein